MLLPATDILGPNIRGITYALASESGRLTITEGYKGLHWKKKDKKQLTTQLELSEAIVLEIYDRSNGTGATEIKNQLPKYDGTVASIFICLKIPENI